TSRNPLGRSRRRRNCRSGPHPPSRLTAGKGCRSSTPTALYGSRRHQHSPPAILRRRSRNVLENDPADTLGKCSLRGETPASCGANWRGPEARDTTDVAVGEQWWMVRVSGRGKVASL